VTSDSTPSKQADFRSKVYGILALAFSLPQENATNLYKSILDAQEIIRTNASVSQPEVDSPSLSNVDLKKEYLRLFVGPGHVKCSPYESIYRQDRPILAKGLVMGPSTADVRRRYAEADLILAKNFNDLPDHIAVEMEFMHFLCAEELRALEDGNSQESTKRREMQQEFLREHLEPWVDRFAECVLRSTRSSFHKSAANLLKTFVKSESEHFQGCSSQ